MESHDNSKSYWRQFFLGKLSLMSAAETQARSEKVHQNFLKFMASESGIWSIYHPLRKEFNPLESIAQIKHVRWTFPRVNQNSLLFYESKVGPSWTKNSLGVVEPPGDPGEQVELSQHKGVIVPALGYGRDGTRLGRGAGYYDRALGSYQGAKVGLGFSIQITNDHLPTEFHDVYMDYIITDEEIIQCRKGK